jgi:hypothetical protein
MYDCALRTIFHRENPVDDPGRSCQTLSVNWRHSKLLFVLLLASVTLLFFVQLPAGSFQSTNGPTTPVTHWRLLLLALFAVLWSVTHLPKIAAVRIFLRLPWEIASLPRVTPAAAEISLRC